jgi:capsular polysaccharide biosynthesis protein
MDVYRALWRRRFIIVLLTVATVVTTYIVVSGKPKVYESKTLVRVQQPASGDLSQIGTAIGVAQHLAQTYAQIASTDSIGDRVYTQLNKKIPRDQIHLSAEPVQDLELMYITAKSSNANWAASVANAAPAALRKWIASTQSKHPDEIQVVNPAGPSASPVSPRVKTSVVIALLAGLVFNGGLAVLIEFLSDRIRDVDELEALTLTPVLATVPSLTFRPPSVRALSEGIARYETIARTLPTIAEGGYPTEQRRPPGGQAR